MSNEMIRVTVRPGRTLWEELAQRNIVIDRPCGGKGTCGRCAVVLSGGESVPACQYRTPGEVEIEKIPLRQFTAVGAFGHYRVLDAKTPAAAVDIGTTTVVLQVFYQDRSVIRNFVNPQRRYGADVMSRIRAANEGGGKDLQGLLWERLQEELRLAVKEMGSTLDCRLVVSANTTMQHLLEGISCERLGAAPFVPEKLTLRKFFMGKTEIVQLPGISAFVGADIVSGLSVIDILHRETPMLFVDLGTNGEMALGCRERLLATSTAAGPAFEGSGLAMRIHGAGMLKLLHRLLEQGIVDEYGTLCEKYFDSGYPVDAAEGGISDSGEEPCVLTQENIRELQMAKAAVCAGVEMLLAEYQISAEQVGTVCLAGGFGCYLDPEDALAVGLLPEKLKGRIVAVGNTSLEGAVQYLADPEGTGQRMKEICRRAELIMLPECEGFEERYIERMNFGLYGN